MSLGLDDLAVVASLGVAVWLLYSMGLRPRSPAVGLVLVGVPLLVWLAGWIWVYQIVADAGLHSIVGAAPAVATYLAVVWIAVRGVGGLTYRIDLQEKSFRAELRAADAAMRRAFGEKPAVSADGRIPVEPYRERLEEALNEFRKLQPPPGKWTQLVEERLELHRSYIEVLLSPVPLGPDVIEPLERRSSDWAREEEKLASEEAAQSKSASSDPPSDR